MITYFADTFTKRYNSQTERWFYVQTFFHRKGFNERSEILSKTDFSCTICCALQEFQQNLIFRREITALLPNSSLTFCHRMGLEGGDGRMKMAALVFLKEKQWLI